MSKVIGLNYVASCKNLASAFYHLIKAAIRDWEGINEFDTHEDFKNIKLANPDGWADLMNTVKELNSK